MRRARALLAFFLLICLAGCASGRYKKQVKALKEELTLVAGKFELAKKENLNLKREITLFRRYQDIDSQRFVRAQDLFTKELAEDISRGEVNVSLSDRGLVVTVVSEKLFATGADVLSDAGKAFLDKVALLIVQAFPANYIYVEGHTDNQSLAIFEWKSDWDFSFARALSVLKYFTEKNGIDPWRLSASGFGQYRPLGSNESKEGRRANRRIEIIVSPQRLKGHVSQPLS